MEPVTTTNLKLFLQRLGERCSRPATLYLLGGSALCFLGSPIPQEFRSYFEELRRQVVKRERGLFSRLRRGRKDVGGQASEV
jgi:hypothetical protein